jgi:putative transcriptional regulator
MADDSDLPAPDAPGRSDAGTVRAPRSRAPIGPKTFAKRGDRTTHDASHLAGKVLVAMPTIGDSRFERTLVLMCEHNEDCAMGIILNRPKHELSLSDILDHMGLGSPETVDDHSVLSGGPCDEDRGFVLHTDDFGVPGSTRRVAPGLSLTATRDVLDALGTPIGPDKAVLALGYAGWGAGQLEQEIQDNAWLVTDLDSALIFSDDHDQKWQRTMSRMGIDPALISRVSGRA